MKPSSRHPGRAIRLAGVVLLGLAPVAWAADEAVVLRLRAERLAAQGRCEEALPLLEQAGAAAPNDARAALVAGQCQIRLRRYPEAVQSLERARALDPSLADLDLNLGMARFHTGDLAGAEEALQAARAREPGRAEVDLYLGLLALQRLETAEAAAALARARVADPDAVEPIASYYEGLAREREGERAEARAALERAKAAAPGTVWAEEADRALERLAQTATERWWVTATAGIEYDDNVVLRGSDVQLPREISSQNDIRAVWAVEIGSEVVRTADWTVGVLATYYGSAHQDLEDFNVQYPGVSLWADRRLSESLTGRFQYDYGYAWVGGSEPYLSLHTWTPALYQNWGRPGLSRAFVAFEKANYFFPTFDDPDGAGAPGSVCPSRSAVVCGPPGVDEEAERNRDGWGLVGGLEHSLPVGTRDLLVFGGYRYHYYSARGQEYSYQGHEARLGFRALLPLDLRLEVTGSYLYRPYRNASTFPDPEDLRFNRQYPLTSKNRSDDVIRVDVLLERPLTDELTLGVRYVWYDQASTTDVFDYDREVIGAYLTVHFGG